MSPSTLNRPLPLDNNILLFQQRRSAAVCAAFHFVKPLLCGDAFEFLCLYSNFLCAVHYTLIKRRLSAILLIKSDTKASSVFVGKKKQNIMNNTVC